jgi:FkbM family methyltransferase
MANRQIYIDCGSCHGQSIIDFKHYFRYAKDYEIYAFECHPFLLPRLERLSKKLNFTLIKKALWIQDNYIALYPGISNKKRTDTLQSSSVMFSKKRMIDKKHPINVDAIDFSQWLQNNFDSQDYIILKMNIEGAEYPILSKMLMDDSLRYINRLYIAWHRLKMTENSIMYTYIEHSVIKTVKTYRWSPVKGKNPFSGGALKNEENSIHRVVWKL